MALLYPSSIHKEAQRHKEEAGIASNVVSYDYVSLDQTSVQQRLRYLLLAKRPQDSIRPMLSYPLNKHQNNNGSLNKH